MEITEFLLILTCHGGDFGTWSNLLIRQLSHVYDFGTWRLSLIRKVSYVGAFGTWTIFLIRQRSFNLFFVNSPPHVQNSIAGRQVEIQAILEGEINSIGQLITWSLNQFQTGLVPVMASLVPVLTSLVRVLVISVPVLNISVPVLSGFVPILDSVLPLELV